MKPVYPSKRWLFPPFALILALAIAIGVLVGSLKNVRPEWVQEDTVAVPRGMFFSSEYIITSEGSELSYSFSVLSGHLVDIYLFTDSDFERFVSGLRPVDIWSFRWENASQASGSPYPPPGTYHATVDNSAYGVAQGSGEVAFHYILYLNKTNSVSVFQFGASLLAVTSITGALTLWSALRFKNRRITRGG